MLECTVLTIHSVWRVPDSYLVLALDVCLSKILTVECIGPLTLFVYVTTLVAKLHEQLYLANNSSNFIMKCK